MPLFSLFLFEKLFLFKPPWSKQAPGYSHSPAWLSPENPAADPAPGQGLELPWSLRRSQGPYCPLALFSPSDLSVSSIFGLRSSYMLEYRWLFTLFLRSARCFTGAERKWTPLPPISLPSSESLSLLLVQFKCHGQSKFLPGTSPSLPCNFLIL